MYYLRNTVLTAIICILILTNAYAENLDSGLRKAAKKGQIEKVQVLLKDGASINSTDRKGKTCLMLASEKGHTEIVKFLLQNGADVTATDKKGESALDKARKKNDVILMLEYALAKKTNTIERYKDFIASYPNNEYVNEAKIKLEQLIYEQSIAIDSIGLYKRFIETYPYSKFVNDVNVRIEALYFKKAQSKNTIAAFKEFVNQYPNSELIDSAHLKITEIHFENINVKNTIQAYDQFIKNYPNSKFVNDAKHGIEKIKYDQTKTENTIESYEQFIKIYPNSKFTNDVNERISRIARNHFDKAKAQDTVEAYEYFIKKYPTCEFSMKAREFIEDLLIQDVIDKENSMKDTTVKGIELKLPASNSALSRRQGNSVALSEQFCFLTGLEGEETNQIAQTAYVIDYGNLKEIKSRNLVRINHPSTSPFIRASHVTVSGNVAFITLENNVHVFRFDGKVWQKETQLFPQVSNDTYKSFGCSLATDGKFAVIGAYGPGEVYVYQYKENNWQLDDTLAPLNLNSRFFGSEVALSGKTIIVGSYKDRAAYIFEFHGGKWVQTAQLSPKSKDDNYQFGQAVALSGDVAVVGSGVGRCGTAYVFRRKQGEWIQEVALTEGPCSNRGFGRALALENDVLLVGQPGDGDQGWDSGAVFVYRYRREQWKLNAKLKAALPVKEGRFGSSVALNGEIALIGSWGIAGFTVSQSGLTPNQQQSGGSAYLYGLRNRRP